MIERRISRAFALIALALTLGGCNLVISETPVFSAADAHGAPVLRPGVWSAAQPNCAFNPNDPIDKWPQCAGGGIIGPDAFFSSVDPNAVASGQPAAATATAKQTTIPYVLAAGEPRIMQIKIQLTLDKTTTATFFYFIALKPTAIDAAGHIVSGEIWPIQCGPPRAPKPGASPDDMSGADVSDHPLPGMKIEKGMCFPTDKAAVINAAAASRAWAGQTGVLKWVRDGVK